MRVRYEFTEVTNLEEALHDTLLEFNGDLADSVVAVAANANITFKPCQLSSAAQKALDEGQAAVKLSLPEFHCLLSRIVQIVDGHMRIICSRPGAQTILDLRVVDSSFAFLETDNQAILHAFDARLTGARRSEAGPQTAGV